ncbi:unnamed protein product [Parajaminaea phylloscopi]
MTGSNATPTGGAPGGRVPASPAPRFGGGPREGRPGPPPPPGGHWDPLSSRISGDRSRDGEYERDRDSRDWEHGRPGRPLGMGGGGSNSNHASRPGPSGPPPRGSYHHQHATPPSSSSSRWSSDRKPYSRSPSPATSMRGGNGPPPRPPRHSYSSSGAGSSYYGRADRDDRRGNATEYDQSSERERVGWDRDRDRDNDRSRDWSRDTAGGPYAGGAQQQPSSYHRDSWSSKRAAGRRDVEGQSRRGSASPPRNRYNERDRSPERSFRREREEDIASAPISARAWGPASASANVRPTDDHFGASANAPAGANGIPTGPRATIGRGGSPAAWGASRGRGVGLGIRGRGGRGGGNHGNHGTHYTAEEGPARSLTRKLDAGGNAVLPDLMPVQATSTNAEQQLDTAGRSSLTGGALMSQDSTEAGEIEEGEAREEGEMDATMQEDRSLRVSEHDVRTAGTERDPAISSRDEGYNDGRSRERDAANRRHVRSPRHPRSKDSPADQIGGEQLSRSSDRDAHAGTSGARASSTTAANPYATAPNVWAAQQQQQRQRSSDAAPPSTAPAPAPPVPVRPRLPLTAASFPRSAQPEWDAEMFALSHHRLAALHRLSLSTSFPTSASVGGTAALAGTPGAITPLGNTPSIEIGDPAMLSTAGATATANGGAAAMSPSANSSLSLRQALLDLREAQLEMEMSGFRRDEVDRARAALV